jgi:hypothetical protein
MLNAPIPKPFVFVCSFGNLLIAILIILSETKLSSNGFPDDFGISAIPGLPIPVSRLERRIDRGVGFDMIVSLFLNQKSTNKVFLLNRSMT